MSEIRIFGVRIRTSWRGVAKWGYPVVEAGGYSFLTRHSDGALGLASYHPRSSNAWHWSVSLTRRQSAMWTNENRRHRAGLWFSGNPHAPQPRWWHRFVQQDALRRSQWHDYYRMPFGWSLCVARQDYHKPRLDPTA